jgi:hypothetical protein
MVREIRHFFPRLRSTRGIRCLCALCSVVFLVGCYDLSLKDYVGDGGGGKAGSAGGATGTGGATAIGTGGAGSRDTPVATGGIGAGGTGGASGGASGGTTGSGGAISTGGAAGSGGATGTGRGRTCRDETPGPWSRSYRAQARSEVSLRVWQ